MSYQSYPEELSSFPQEQPAQNREGSPPDSNTPEYHTQTRMKVDALELQLKSLERAINTLVVRLQSQPGLSETTMKPLPDTVPTPQVSQVGIETPQSNVEEGGQALPPNLGRTTPVLVPSASRRKPLPKGEPFSGDKAAFRAWQVTIEHKLGADLEFIGGPREQFAFIWANLSPAVQREVAPFYETGGTSGDWNPVTFMEYLQFCYNDVHGKERAQAKLDALQQGRKESFSDFFPRFEQLLTQAGGGSWDGEQRLHKLRRALNPALRQLALHRGVNRTDYSQAVRQYQSIAVDFETAAMEDRNRTHSLGGQKQKMDTDGDVEMVNVAAIGVSQGSGNKGRQRQGKGAQKRQRKNWIPEELFNQRREQDLCTRCAQKGHYARDCGNSVVIQAVSAATAGETASEDESGN
jgi:hypothetical protein